MTRTRTPARSRPLALGYVRVSTAEQVQDGASLDAQRALLAAEADRRGWDLEVVADEGVSGKSLDGRPGLASALARLDRREADALLAVRLDRVSRSVHDFSGLMRRARRRGWSLVTLDLGLDTSTPTGNAMANMLATFAELERDVIGQRTREVMAQRRAEGVHLGRARELPVEVVERIVADRARGMSLRALADALTADGTPTAHGGARWYASTVQAVLASTTGQAAAAA